jgi:exopolysaccharide biosynthesis polyprenyl glycosylphosphotransferase
VTTAAQEAAVTPLELAASTGRRGRGRIVKRRLALADAGGLSFAFLIATLAFAEHGSSIDRVSTPAEVGMFVLTLPVWLTLAKMLGLYERDEERADHSTSDELFGVVNLVTLGTWTVFMVAWATGMLEPQFARLVSFWLLAILLILASRAIARSASRAMPGYRQRAVIVGVGDVGQLVARKVRQHSEYSLDLIGFVDTGEPLSWRRDIDVPILGGIDELGTLVARHGVERVIVAFARDPDAETMRVLRTLRDRDVTVDVVPRMFELVGPRATFHTLEGLPLVCLPPLRVSRSARMLKRLVDVAGAAVGLVLTAPLFAYIALRVRLDSEGPAFFRQVRLGENMRPFVTLKFRTMSTGTDESAHRKYVGELMSSRSELGENGIYKLERPDAVTPFGRWLRRTSLDELPQLVNVLKGDMSLVGPRPCIPYEVENFEPHHYERFVVPQGITGLWQVTARANSTFGEALEMDLAYVRGWSLALDLRLLLRTPFALLRQRGSTA